MRYDRIVHYTMVLLTFIGLVFIFSAYTVPRLTGILVSPNADWELYFHAFKPFINLLPVLILGFLIYFALLFWEDIYEYFRHYKFFKRLIRPFKGLTLGRFILYSVWFTLFTLVLVILEKFIFHLRVNRWLIAPKHMILVTGLAITSYYLFLAYQFSRKTINWSKVLTYSFLFWILLLLQPDVGTTILLVFSFLTLLYFRTPQKLVRIPSTRWKFEFSNFYRRFYVFITSSIGVLALFAILNANVKVQLPNPFEGTKFGHVIVRINNWLNPFRDVTASSYQIANSLYAVHRGGIDGVGYGFGLRKLYMGPTVHTDFIFATIGEETGFLFSVFIFLITLALLLRLIVISYRFEGLFEKFFTLLVAIETFSLSLINAGMAVNLIPSKGWPYPLISYAPFYVLFYIIQLGIVQYFVRKRYLEIF